MAVCCTVHTFTYFNSVWYMWPNPSDSRLQALIQRGFQSLKVCSQLVWSLSASAPHAEQCLGSKPLSVFRERRKKPCLTLTLGNYLKKKKKKKGISFFGRVIIRSRWRLSGLFY